MYLKQFKKNIEMEGELIIKSAHQQDKNNPKTLEMSLHNSKKYTLQ